ncbi:LysR family transcriptional regulator [Olsenella profusa]|nr:LysR family transcriptional regulator [Olsenella profusa]
MAGRMTIRHLELFRAVCEAGGVSAAARELGVSQPSVSQAVRDLELHFGVELFDREGRQMLLTEQGARLLARARAVLDDLGDLECAMSEAAGTQTLRIASSITCGTCHLPAALARLAAAAPQVRPRVRVEDSQAVERDVVAGVAEVGLVEGLVHDGTLVAEPFARDELVAVAAPGRAGEAVTAAELARGRLVLRERGSGVRELFEAALTERGLACDPVWESVSTEALVAAVEAGLGASVLPASLVDRAVGEGRVARLAVTDLTLSRELLVIRRRGRALTPATQAFLAALGA